MAGLGLQGAFGVAGGQQSLQDILAQRVAAQKYADLQRQQDVENALKQQQVNIQGQIANQKGEPSMFAAPPESNVYQGGRLIQEGKPKPVTGGRLVSVNQNGKPVFVPEGQAAGLEPYQKPDKPQAAPVTRYSRATVTGPDGQPMEANYDAVTGGYYNVDTGERIKGVKPPPTSSGGGLGMAAIQLRNKRAASALNSIERLQKLAPVRGPGLGGIVQGMGQVAAGTLGYNTQARQYQALLQPTAMQMAAAIQGAANLSDNERKAMADMLGSINTMDYESQMALLKQASELVGAGADIKKVNGFWQATSPGVGFQPMASHDTPDSAVPMVAPDGRSLMVPAAKVAEMEAKGAKRR